MSEQIVKNSTYALATGKSASARLNLINKIYGKASRSFLTSTLKNKNKLRILSVGCGNGNMELWLAKKLKKHNGIVVAIDKSEEQLHLARQKAEWQKIFNAFFLKGDGMDFSFSEKFDVVYTRFLLVHVTNPTRVISNMLDALKSGGTIICEDMVGSSIMGYPYTDALREAVALVANLGKYYGLDYDFGLKIYTTLFHYHVQNLQVQYTQPTFFTPKEKNLLFLSLQESQQSYLKAGLISLERLSYLLDTLKKLAQDEASLVTWGVVQVKGTKIEKNHY